MGMYEGHWIDLKIFLYLHYRKKCHGRKFNKSKNCPSVNLVFVRKLYSYPNDESKKEIKNSGHLSKVKF